MIEALAIVLIVALTSLAFRVGFVTRRRKSARRLRIVERVARMDAKLKALEEEVRSAREDLATNEQNLSSRRPRDSESTSLRSHGFLQAHLSDWLADDVSRDWIRVKTYNDVANLHEIYHYLITQRVHDRLDSAREERDAVREAELLLKGS